MAFYEKIAEKQSIFRRNTCPCLPGVLVLGGVLSSHNLGHGAPLDSAPAAAHNRRGSGGGGGGGLGRRDAAQAEADKAQHQGSD